MTRPVSRYAGLTLRAAEDIGLAVIGLATIVAGWQEVQAMLTAGKVSLADLLLMFIYLEVLTMVGLYFESGKLPVRFPLYIGMVALARYLILDMKDLDVWRMLGVAPNPRLWPADHLLHHLELLVDRELFLVEHVQGAVEALQFVVLPGSEVLGFTALHPPGRNMRPARKRSARSGRGPCRPPPGTGRRRPSARCTSMRAARACG